SDPQQSIALGAAIIIILAAATLSQNRTGNRRPGTTARVRGEQLDVATGRIARHPRECALRLSVLYGDRPPLAAQSGTKQPGRVVEAVAGPRGRKFDESGFHRSVWRA